VVRDPDCRHISLVCLPFDPDPDPSGTASRGQCGHGEQREGLSKPRRNLCLGYFELKRGQRDTLPGTWKTFQPNGSEGLSTASRCSTPSVHSTPLTDDDDEFEDEDKED